MAGNGQRKQLGLDTNFLLDLARQVEVAYDFITVFPAAGYSLLAGPTVFQELAFAGLYGSEPDKSFARKAVARARDWGVRGLRPVRSAGGHRWPIRHQATGKASLA